MTIKYMLSDLEDTSDFELQHGTLSVYCTMKTYISVKALPVGTCPYFDLDTIAYEHGSHMSAPDFLPGAGHTVWQNNRGRGFGRGYTLRGE